MKLQVFGRDHSGQHVREAQLPPSAPSDTSVNSPKNVIPFPTSASMAAYPNDGPLQLGPPGQYSHTRERFLYTDLARSRPRSVSSGHDGHMTLFSPSPAPISPPHHGIPSPTFFYTSMPLGSSDATAPAHDHHLRRPSEHFAYDTIGRPYVFPGSSPDGGYNREHRHILEQANRVSEGNSVPWEAETPVAQLPDTPHQDCYYCPSRGASGECYIYPPQSRLYSTRSPLVPANLPLSPPVPIFGTGFNYDNTHTLPANNAMNMNVASSFEHPVIPVSRSATGEAWFSTPGIVPHVYQGIPFYPQQLQVPAGYSPYNQPQKPEPHLQIDPPPLHTNNLIFRANPSSASAPSSRLTSGAPSLGSSANNTREPPTPPERNQLNLARIEDGQDTRTTVMIKNIPNKMSDKDLIAFIGKVCPRKIDFLYLRMDFQNGISFVILYNGY